MIKKMCPGFYLLITALQLLSYVFAQTSYHVTTGQGLATNQLTILVKDRQNNMWFGSYAGLHKHEGTSIKVYKKSGSDSLSLSSKEMHAVFEDRLGFIWAGTTGGLDKLDPKSGIILHYKLKSANTEDDRIGYIISIFQDDKDDIWVSTEAGIFILNYKSGKYQLVPDEKSANGIPDHALLYKGSIKTGTGLWMFASGYVIFYDFKSRQFFHQYNNPLNKPIFKLREKNNSNGGSEVCIDSLDNLYFILNNNVLIKYNLTTEKLDSFRFNSPANAWLCCYSLAADYKGNVWIGFRYGGMLFFNSISHQFTTIRYNDGNTLIQSDYVYSLCEDYLKRMWVTTSNGIFIINYYDSIVQQKYLSDKKEFVNINYTAGIISKDNSGNIYIPFLAGGLFKYNVFTEKNTYFPITDTSIKAYRYAFTGEKNLVYISAKKTLIPTDTLIRSTRPAASKQTLYTLLGARPGSVVFVLKYNEKAIYYKKTNGFIYYYNGTDSLAELESTGFSKQACFSRDSSFLYYIAGNGDIIKRNLVTFKSDTILLYRKLRALNFAYLNTRDVADDGNGNIWVTSQNGLIKYNQKSEQVAVYTTSNGLLHDFTFTLCCDSKKRLWVGSMGGVNLYDPGKNIFINVFPESPDKLSNYFGSSLEANNGHIYFLFGAKLININPDGFLQQKMEERQLKLDEVQINGNTVDDATGALWNLSYRQNRIYFRFGLLEFAETEKVKYFYRLQGLDKNWIDIGNRPEVTFNSLQPGKYVFHVTATDLYGNQVNKQLEVPFTIKQPFWKMWWFIALAILLGIYLVYIAVKWREKNIKTLEADKTRLQQLTAEKYKAQFESEQISSFFTTSLLNKHDVDDVLWDVAKNLIGKLGFVDCMIYLWNDDKTKLVQKAGYGPKGSMEELESKHFDVMPGQGVVGAVAQTCDYIIIPDTTVDGRYRVDDLARLSEICVPIKYNEQLIGAIDSEHYEKNFFTRQHLQVLSTIATLIAGKITSIESEQRLRHQKAELADINQQLAEVQLAALRSQMNPHFIFNALNSIKKFVIANEPANAEKYLGKFSKLIRSILDNSQSAMVTIEKEVQLLKLYLDLEQLRFGDRLTYKIEVDEAIDRSEIRIPSMIIQPFVENAMLHGIMHKETGGMVTIVLLLKNDWLEITIADNGVGRAKSAEYKSNNIDPHRSIGIEVATKRLQALKKNADTPAGIDIIDLMDDEGTGTGTKIIICIPL